MASPTELNNKVYLASLPNSWRPLLNIPNNWQTLEEIYWGRVSSAVNPDICLVTQEGLRKAIINHNFQSKEPSVFTFLPSIFLNSQNEMLNTLLNQSIPRIYSHITGNYFPLIRGLYPGIFLP
jgi:hypothetical protein